MMQDRIIEVSNLVKRYKKASENAVDAISFYVERGSLFSLLGPNGAGKTTTISILTTLLSKTAGEVMIDGFDVDTNPSEVRQRIGVIFQNPSLDTNLSAEENIRIYAMLYGLYPFYPTYRLMPQSYKDRVHQLVEVVGLKDDLFKAIRTFSGGMKRKLEIVRSLMPKPSVLFLDEPTTGLDPLSRKNLWQYLRQVQQESHTTIFLTTHYLEEAEDADYVCIVNHGKVVAKGTPEEITNILVDRSLLLWSKEGEKLGKEAAGYGLQATLLRQGYGGQAGNGPVRIQLKNSVEAQEILKKIKTPLKQIRLVSPTLEEAYLKIIDGNE